MSLLYKSTITNTIKHPNYFINKESNTNTINNKFANIKFRPL